jgi:LacI family transcriptional regulator
LAAYHEAAAAGYAAISVRVHRVEGFNAAALARQLQALGESDGLGVIPLEHPEVREGIRAIRARGVPVATLVSDMPNIGSVGYVGIDNRAAGRLAAELIGRLTCGRRGEVLLFLGSRSYRGHEEREIGFRHVLEDEYPQLVVLPVPDARDDNDKTRAETLKLLKERRDVVAVYNIAGGNLGIGSALEAAGVTGNVVYVAHELTEHTRRFLASGVMQAAIDQDPEHEARELIGLLTAQARGEVYTRTSAFRITPFFRENMP